jgi:hypothetical protein
LGVGGLLQAARIEKIDDKEDAKGKEGNPHM